MTAAVDKREYLIGLGLAKPGRGKFSTAAHEALAEAERQGTVFIDKKASTATVTVVNDDGERTQEVRLIDPFAQHPDPIRTDSHYTFTGEHDTLSVAVTEVCEGCGHSLGWCYCPTPTFRFWKSGEVYRLV